MAKLTRLYKAEQAPDRVRYWGTEFEHPYAGCFRDSLESYLRESHNDSTVPIVASREDCQCLNCSHSCDCERCEIRSHWCEFNQHTEVTMKPSQRPRPQEVVNLMQELAGKRLDPNDFSDWCNGCEMDGDDCGCGGENLADWGFHTHLDARDLTLSQVASATRLLSVFLEQFSEELGADGDGYNNQLDHSEIESIRQGYRVSGRPRVNPNPVISYFGEHHEEDRQDPTERPNHNAKATIEIRGFRYTSDPDFHLARVAFVRAVVDYVKAGQPVYWLAREKSLEAVCEALEFSKH